MNRIPVSTHLLDLKRNFGHLPECYFDLPKKPAASQHYLRRQDRWAIPASYRTGLAFFGSVLIVSMVAITAVDAHISAQAQHSLLGAQILQEMSQLNQDLQQHVHRSAEQDAGLVKLQHETDVSQTDADLLGEQVLSVVSNEYAELIELGLHVSSGYQSFGNMLENWQAEYDVEPTDRLALMKRNADQVLTAWDGLDERLNRLSSINLAAEEYRALLEMVAETQRLRPFVEAFSAGNAALQRMMGQHGPQRIVILIQDSNTRRATGGALSAGVEVLIDEGEVLVWKPFHVAEHDRSLQVSLPPPAEMAGITDRWSLATANSDVDLARSADHLQWFWQREARSSVDSFILVTTNALERFFAAGDHWADLGEEQASELKNIALRWSALRIKDDQEALKALSDLALQQVWRVAQSPEAFLQAWPAIEQATNGQQLVVSGQDSELRGLWNSLSHADTTARQQGQDDYLMVASVNKGLNASDRWIDQSYQLATAVSDKGSIEQQLTIERRHVWSAAYATPLFEKVGSVGGLVYQQLSSAANESMIQVRVPLGSELISTGSLAAESVRQEDFDDHRVWTFDSNLSPGQGEQYQLSYRLPWSFDTSSVDNYRLRVAKQPGTNPVSFRHEIAFPDGVETFQELGSDVALLDGDLDIAVVAGRNP